MKLEVGKTYKTRGGEKVRVVYDNGPDTQRTDLQFIGVYVRTGCPDTWADGGANVELMGPHDNDLVSEDIPTRTYYRAVVYKRKGVVGYHTSPYWFASKEQMIPALSLLEYVEWEEKQLPCLGG